MQLFLGLDRFRGQWNAYKNGLCIALCIEGLSSHDDVQLVIACVMRVFLRRTS